MFGLKTVYRFIPVKIGGFKKIEEKLERLALKGLFPENIGRFIWQFRKGEPKNLKYTVTFFEDATDKISGLSSNQEMYYELAAGAGWERVGNLAEMQVFSSELENPVPFETDEREKFENIKRLLNKNHLKYHKINLVIISFALFHAILLFKNNPFRLITDNISIILSVQWFILFLISATQLINFKIWCKESEKSISGGGEIVDVSNPFIEVIATVGLSWTIISALFLFVFSRSLIVFILLALAQIILIFAVKEKAEDWLESAETIFKKIIYKLFLTAGAGLYLVIIALVIYYIGFTEPKETRYQTLELEREEYVMIFEKYHDEIPLTVEDLYGNIDFELYSRKLNYEENTPFINKKSYEQTTPDNLDGEYKYYPEIRYSVYTYKSEFAKRITHKGLLKIPHWKEGNSFRKLNDFDLAEVYEELENGKPTGAYVFFYEDKAINITIAGEAATEQLKIIDKKLGN